METPTSKNFSCHSTRKFITKALFALAISLGASSCGKTTQKDINNQKGKIELLSTNISHYINARKKLVNDYNTLLEYPKTEANKYEIDNHLCLYEEEIYECDEKIKDLVEEKLDAEVTLNEKIEDRGTTGIHSPIDPNKRDYLLAIQ